MAFHPNYSENGYFYVNYTRHNPRRNVIARYSVSDNNPNQADSQSSFVILEVNQPYTNHNGGQMGFGPDDYLYIGLGDGGSRGDPNRHGQNLETLLGSILRIDVRTDESGNAYVIPESNPFIGYGDTQIRKEIWAYGLRNPWKFTFDKVTGQMWAGDVGQNDYEEIDIIQQGLNYGWNVLEGTHCYHHMLRPVTKRVWNHPFMNTLGVEVTALSQVAMFIADRRCLLYMVPIYTDCLLYTSDAADE